MLLLTFFFLFLNAQNPCNVLNNNFKCPVVTFGKGNCKCKNVIVSSSWDGPNNGKWNMNFVSTASCSLCAGLKPSQFQASGSCKKKGPDQINAKVSIPKLNSGPLQETVVGNVSKVSFQFSTADNAPVYMSVVCYVSKGEPTEAPTEEETGEPTELPTESPTESPTGSPTGSPTTTPTLQPTFAPTNIPTPQPTIAYPNNCFGCLKLSNVGWCVQNNICIPYPDVDKRCVGNQVLLSGQQQNCPIKRCIQYKDCGACVSGDSVNGTCGWCPGKKKCVSGPLRKMCAVWKRQC